METLKINYKTIFEQDIEIQEGKRVIQALVDKYKYKKLSDTLSEQARADHLKYTPEYFKNDINSKYPLYTLDNTLIAKAYDRLVVGDYGAFIEIDEEDINKENLIIQKGQEYRLLEKYKNVKYLWLTAKDTSGIKIYHQKNIVTYADYRIGKYYISPFEVFLKIPI